MNNRAITVMVVLGAALVAVASSYVSDPTLAKMVAAASGSLFGLILPQINKEEGK